MDDSQDVRWRKSSFSTAGGNCVEVAWLDDGRVGVRDSKRPDDSPLVFGPAAFTAFLAVTKTGAFDTSA